MGVARRLVLLGSLGLTALVLTASASAATVVTPATKVVPLRGHLHVGSMTDGPGGGIWFTSDVIHESGQPYWRLSRISSSGRVTRVSGDHRGADATSLVYGPQDSFWSDDETGIRRVTQDGTYTPFGTQTCGFLFGLDNAVDGSLFFVNRRDEEICSDDEDGDGKPDNPGVDEIGRYAPESGAVTRWPITGGDFSWKPQHAVTGTAGVYFTNAASGPAPVGRLDPATGAITRASSRLISDPSGIDVGPDGTVWVTERKRGRVVAIGPAGAARDIDVGGRPENPRVDRDGNVWFRDGDRSTSWDVGRVTPAGAVRLFRLPQQFESDRIVYAGAVVQGADGYHWVAAQYREAGAFLVRLGAKAKAKPEPPPRAPSGCRHPGERVVTRNAETMILVRAFTDWTSGRPVATRRYVACRRAASRRFRLVDAIPNVEQMGPIRVAGRYVAYASGLDTSWHLGFEPFTTFRTVTRLDIRTGRKLELHARGDEEEEDALEVTDLELDGAGRMAWIVPTFRFDNGEFVYRVVTYDGRRLSRIAESPSLAPRSLVLRGGRARWRGIRGLSPGPHGPVYGPPHALYGGETNQRSESGVPEAAVVAIDRSGRRVSATLTTHYVCPSGAQFELHGTVGGDFAIRKNGTVSEKVGRPGEVTEVTGRVSASRATLHLVVTTREQSDPGTAETCRADVEVTASRDRLADVVVDGLEGDPDLDSRAAVVEMRGRSVRSVAISLSVGCDPDEPDLITGEVTALVRDIRTTASGAFTGRTVLQFPAGGNTGRLDSSVSGRIVGRGVTGVVKAKSAFFTPDGKSAGSCRVYSSAFNARH